MDNKPHLPVLLDQVVDVLTPKRGARYIDGTFGAGGYSRAFLEAADCTVWGIDCDPSVIETGERLAHEFGGRLTFVSGRYGDMDSILSDIGVTQIEGIALDLGVSSMQIDDPERGFSFREDGPLDMRMSKSGETAADAVNKLGERELADIIYRYGEERASRQVARAIVNLRTRRPINRTQQLAEIVRGVVKHSQDGIDPATRTFQALRIYVNDEIGELERGLAAAESLLVPGGRLVVLSFHSLEDRCVKQFFKTRSGFASLPSRHYPLNEVVSGAPTFKIINRSAVRPTSAEISINPRARSARMRWGERIGVVL